MDEMKQQELYDLVVRIIELFKQKGLPAPTEIGEIKDGIVYPTWTIKEWPPKKLHYDHDRFDSLAEEWSRREDEE